ncbi:hypothetical protein LOZ57_006796 [Ophidiomyces ophidiicola]|uniref:uncharacterized protein n=1 Tax=Ophidiomyces ophidiicola TaxID=1387563 RepID=UPI0020C28985|nr:uncharacterized protein LOZ57_006796 [Ophidiomyces ophidiicola]KAI1936152.1 hypothetical protein LOZ57_006796 [Ophidiomyces ophidiicola]KAI2047722.1 hypothetical protein LOZ43_005578 [Ophidiomyces ophidiicola]
MGRKTLKETEEAKSPEVVRELENGSDIEMSDGISIVDERPKPVKPKDRPWVSEIVRKHCSNTSTSIPDIFSQDATVITIDLVKRFFDQLNAAIRERDKAEGHEWSSTDIDTINFQTYNGFRNSWLKTVKKFQERTIDAKKGWSDFATLQASLAKFNKMHNLPEGWNLDVSWAESILGKQSAPPTDAGSSGEINELEYDLQSLRMRSRPTFTREDKCKVLYWWKAGKYNIECFVQYKRGGRSVHRIESMAYHEFDKETVPRIRTEDRQLFQTSGDSWKFSAKDIDKLLAVGWRIPRAYNANDDALQHIRPPSAESSRTKYPRTELLIQFKDGSVTLETRGGFRRAVRNKGVADRMIYTMAEERESKYNLSTDKASERSVHFGGTSLSGYSVDRLRPSGKYPPYAKSSGSAKSELMQENHELKERLRLLERQLEKQRSLFKSSDSDDEHFSNKEL